MIRSPFFRLALWVVLSVLVLFSAAAMFVYFNDWNRHRPWINQQISQAIHRPFEIRGDLSVDWQWPQTLEPSWQRWIPGPVVSIKDVHVGNPAGFESGDPSKPGSTAPPSSGPGSNSKASAPAEHGVQFARIGQATINLVLPPLLWRTFDIRRVDLSDPDVRLLRKPDGSNNWNFNLPNAATGEEKRWTVSLGALSVDRGQVAYDDAKLELAARAQLASLASEDTENGLYGVGFTLSGKYGKAEITGEGKTGQLLSLRDEKIDYPLRFEARAGKLAANAVGIIENPRALSGLDFRVSVKGGSMADLYRLTGLVLPDTPEFQTRGRLLGTLEPNNPVWTYRDFTGTVGQSDLRGELTYTSARPRPKLSGKLSSRQLRLTDLGPSIGIGSSQPDKPKRPGKVLPDDPFATDRWDKMDMDIEYEGLRVIRPEAVPIESLHLRAVMENAQLKLAPLDFGVARGRFKTQVMLDAKTKPLRASVRGTVDNLSLSALFPKIELMKKSLGRLDGGVALDGQGNSIASILASANGEAKLYVRDGVMSQQLLDLAGLNLGSVVLSKMFGTDKEVRLRCAIADVPVSNGVAYARNLKVNTEDALIDITGTADMAREYVDLDVNPKAYELKFFSLRTPLEVRGPFAKAHVGVKPGPLVLRAAVAVAAVAAAPGALVLVPLTVPGAEDDEGCAPLLANATKAPKAGPAKASNQETSRVTGSSTRSAPIEQPAAGESSAGAPLR
ncbi:AsmA family protein [Ottowia thiooxydans]|uniref:AsmA family protein n=1 Tax=Ottowia thiooxydans TaxID=219182 RepID=UPI000A02AD3F|nr:AsmA family protein [Ottowia thiooxydans]